MNKLTNENGLYYIGTFLCAMFSIIALIGIVIMIANNYPFTQMIIAFIVLVASAFAARYLYNKTA